METRNCQFCKKDFEIDADDFGFYEKVKVPAPTFCPECRRTRRSAWRNNMSLYTGKCALCSKSVVTLYSPDSGIVIYCNKCWWSDKWDPKDFGVEYDFSRPFFEQFDELMKRVPHMAIVNDDGIASLNCEYTHDWWFSKNCYMCFSGWRVENVMYSFFITGGKDIADGLINMGDTSFTYDCVNCTHAYRLKHSFFSRACVNSQYLYDCHNCSDCFMCTGLKNKRYHFKNVQYGKEEYEKIVASYNLDTWEGNVQAKKEYNEFILEYPRRFAWHKLNVGSSGDILSYCKNTRDSYISKKCENCRYGDFLSSDKDVYDTAMTGESQECYESTVVDHSQLNRFGIFSVKSQDITYTQHCHSSKYLFGCIGIRNGKYCILNKEYSREEYEALVLKIIGHMNEMPYKDSKGREYRFGEFYPAELSPFGYNETVAQEYNSLTKEAAVSLGFKWQDNLQRTTGKETLAEADIPKRISETTDDILKEILACNACGRNYRIVPQELTFYRKMDIPIPHACFQCRHSDRVARLNPFALYDRVCDCANTSHAHTGKCMNAFQSTYENNRPEIVYCESCYQKETS